MELKDGRWQVKSLAAFKSERHLQDLLLDDPGLVPGCAGAAGIDELWIPGVGSIDLVFVDDLGVVSLVECKLNANREIRREVVGQVFAYASGLAGTALHEFEARWADRSSARSKTARTLVADVEGAAGSDIDAEAFRTALAENLETGRFQLVVAVDVITPELKAIIEYLSVHLDETVNVLALEVGRIPAGNEAFLVVETYGAELATAKAKAAPTTKRRWTLPEINDAVAALPHPEEREAIEALLQMAQEKSARVNGGTGRYPSAGFYYPFGGKSPSLWSLYVRDTGADVAFNVGSVANVSADAGERYRSLVAEMLGVPAESVTPYQQVRVGDLLERKIDGRGLVQLMHSVLNAGPTDAGSSERLPGWRE
jgi:hypothetical protein